MTRLAIWLLVAFSVAACSTRTVVVTPEDVPKFSDPQWTITSEPASRPR